MVAIFVAFMFLSLVLTDLGVEKWKAWKAARALRRAKSEPAISLEALWQVPEGVYLSNAHTWFRADPAGGLEIGADPLIGRAIREDPGRRVRGRPYPFEALAWAICEQLIEYERAAAIQRRLVARLGRRCAASGLRDAPTASAIARQAPALLASLDLHPSRALTMIHAAREVCTGRADLYASDHERAWRRLRAVNGIGSWTIQTMALTGQGRLDQLPAGDLAYLKLVGRMREGGDPRARATEAEVERFFERIRRLRQHGEAAGDMESADANLHPGRP